MDDRVIHSSSWTGPPEDRVLPGRVPTHGYAQTSVTSEDELARRTELANARIPPELRPAARWLGGAFLLSPLFVLLGGAFSEVTIPDAFIVARLDWFAYWAIAIAACLLVLFRFPRDSTFRWRLRLLGLMVSASYALAIFYPYAAISAHSSAVASISERTFEIRLPPRCRGCSSRYVHQRADGTTVEGQDIGAAVPYGTTCAEVQRLDGDYGFAWVRVLQRSAPPEHEMAWPIRREDCFTSSKPVSSLHG